MRTGKAGLKGLLLALATFSPTFAAEKIDSGDTAWLLKPKLGYDDSLDAFGVHGLCGIWGALATGLLADPSVSGKAGLFFGNVEQFIVQLISVIAVIVYSGIVSFVVAMVVKAFVGLRVDEEEEFDGLDKAVHGERGFELE